MPLARKRGDPPCVQVAFQRPRWDLWELNTRGTLLTPMHRRFCAQQHNSTHNTCSKRHSLDRRGSCLLSRDGHPVQVLKHPPQLACTEQWQALDRLRQPHRNVALMQTQALGPTARVAKQRTAWRRHALCMVTHAKVFCGSTTVSAFTHLYDAHRGRQSGVSRQHAPNCAGVARTHHAPLAMLL